MYEPLVDAELLSYSSLGFVGTERGDDSLGLLFCNARLVCFLPARLSPTFCTVPDVFDICAETQMRRVDTRWIIAAMQHEHTVRDFPIAKHPYKAVRADALPVQVESPIPVAI